MQWKGGGVAILIAVLSVSAPAIADARPTAADSQQFPAFRSIEPHVEFWTRVYGEWSLGQIAVHDIANPGIVYEVADLPGVPDERYTENQREFIAALLEGWKERLRALDRKVQDKAALNDDEKRIVLLISERSGSAALSGAAERIRTQRGIRERFRRGVEISSRYDATIREIFREAGLPEELAYLPHVESSFQASARSSAGAVGVWQFTRGTGRSYLRINSAVDERLDPIAAAYGAATYLAEAYGKFGSWPIALTSYNHGQNGMRRAVDRFGANYERIFNEYDGRLFGFASKNFYAEFLAARHVASRAHEYFPEGIQPEPLLDHDRVQLDGNPTPSRLAKAYGLPLKTLVALNPAWNESAWRRGLALPEGSIVWLPAGTLERVAHAGRDTGVSLAGWIDDDGRYVVQPGDTLSNISDRFGVRIAALRELNGIAPGHDLIHVGQHLKLSARLDEDAHVVRRGDNLSSIARTYGMSVERLRELNGFAPNESLIHAGQRLRVWGDPAEVAARVHVVRSGETLIRIAVSYGVALADLLLHNRLSEKAVIFPGQQILIPSGR